MRALDLGADDYVCTPFGVEELRPCKTGEGNDLVVTVSLAFLACTKEEDLQ